MRQNNDGAGLFRLLAGHLLLFALTLVLITAAAFRLWDACLTSIYRSADWDALLADSALAAGKYELLKRHLNGAGDFAVYAPDGTLAYASSDGFDASLTEGEAECIHAYGESSVVEAYEQTSDGERRTLALRRLYTEDGEIVHAMALDEDLRVVWGGFDDGRASYTPREFLYLTDRRFDGAYVSRARFTGADGLARTLLVCDKPAGEADTLRLYNRTRWVWLIFLPLYVADAGLFIWWLRRRIARPLRRLNDAVAAQAAGRSARVGDCGGPREIRRIAESFDRFAQQLEASEAERRRLDEGRRKLIADVSHDLKTPLTVICGGIDAVCDGKVPPDEAQRTLRMVRRRAETLAQLADTFHEYGKTAHPQFTLCRERTDVCEFLRAYLAARYDEIELAGLSLEANIPDAPAYCMLDAAQLHRALDNLVTNAIRHNRLGTVLFADVRAEGGRAVIVIADNGEGIDPGRRAHIFEPFVTGDEARTSPGSGLGLSIARRIVEKHGGTIALSARCAPGRTTEFVITLPLAPD